MSEENVMLMLIKFTSTIHGQMTEDNCTSDITPMQDENEFAYESCFSNIFNLSATDKTLDRKDK